MASTFRLQIITPEGVFYDDKVEMTVVRTTQGDIGIQGDHMLTVSPLKIGRIKIKHDGEFKEAALSEGFLQVDTELTRVITDTAEWPEEIDIKRAEEAKKRAERRLESNKKSDIDLVRAQIALRKALNRIDVASDSKKRM